MQLPAKIKINRQPGTCTEEMGHFEGTNQFWCLIGGLNNGQENRWYVFLHKFDTEGNHIGTSFTRVGDINNEEHAKLAERTLVRMVFALGPTKKTDIQIRQFKATIDGILIGLMPISELAEEDFEDEELIDPQELIMIPGDLFFRHPWDGDFET